MLLSIEEEGYKPILAISFLYTFTYIGLTNTLLSYMQKWAWFKAWCTYFLHHIPPSFSFRTTLYREIFGYIHVLRTIMVVNENGSSLD